MAVAHVVFTKQAGTGSQPVTGIGFRPKAVYFFWTAQTSHGIDDGCAFGHGVSDGTLHFARYTAMADGSADADGVYINEFDRCIVVAPTASSGNPSITDEATLDAFTSDGFELNWQTNSGSALKIHAFAFGGPIQAALKHVTVSGALSPVTVSGLDFTPDVIFGLGSNTDSDLSFAPSAIAYAPSFSDATTQRSMFALLRGDNAGDAASYGAKTNRLFSLRNIVGALFHGAENEWASVSALTGDGATITAANSQKTHALLFLRGARLAIGTVLSPSSPGTVSASIGFQALGAIVTAAPTETDGASGPQFSVGAWTPDSTGCVGVSYDDNLAAVQSNVTDATARLLIPANTAASSTERIAATLSQTDDGFDVVYSASDTANRPLYYIAFGASVSRYNLLTGSNHSVAGDDNLIAGSGGSIVGDRNVLFALCGGSPAPSIDGDDTFKVCADAIELEADTIDLVGAVTLPDDTVTNAMAANMAEATIKGRAVGAGTGDPEDLTPAQATAILDVMVGDSGSGGTKGLVPAPAPGDAAAGKFFSASGDFEVPTAAATVDVDALGALDGDGSPGAPLAVRVDGVTIDINGSNELEVLTTPAGIVRAWGFTIDGAGAVITTGLKGFSPPIPFAGTITKVTLISCDGDGPAISGSAVVDIWKDVYANYPPTVADTITASAKPTLSSATKYSDATLTGWSTSVSIGDVFAWNVDSASSVKRLTVTLEITT